MGGNMLMADIGLVANALTVLNVQPDVIAEVTEVLLNNSDGLEGQVVTDVSPGWFGGSGNAHRIGVNTRMAHQAVEEGFTAFKTMAVPETAPIEGLRPIKYAEACVRAMREAVGDSIVATFRSPRDG